MPRSVFMGRVVVAGDPLWLPEDRAWALALLQVEASDCPGCGQPWETVSDPDNEFQFKAELTRCHACSTSARTVQAYQDKGGAPEGLHVHTELVRG